MESLKIFYKKYRQVLLYLFFGGLSFVLSVSIFTALCSYGQMNELIANVLSWIVTVTFCFFTNRVWVFESHVEGVSDFVKQWLRFYLGRLLTLLIEELLIFGLITCLNLPELPVKIFSQIVVILLNYIFSKFWIFRKTPAA